MNHNRLHAYAATTRTRRCAATIGILALVSLTSLLSACGDSESPAPTGTPASTSTTSPSPAPSSSSPIEPTEKYDPSGGNLFTPDVKAPPAPMEPPGVHRHEAH
jgi:hypothetical protein